MDAGQLSRRQMLQMSGLAAVQMTSGMVMAESRVTESGLHLPAQKSCIFVLLCGGPSQIDTWDMKPEAPLEYRGPYSPISTKVPGMQINEMHTRLAKLTDEFALIRSMSHPGGIANHFDAMHNLLSGKSMPRPDDSPYLGSVLAQLRPSQRNVMSYAWLIRCVGDPVFCAPNIGSGGYLGSAYSPIFVGAADNHPAMPDFKPPSIYDIAEPERAEMRRQLLARIESPSVKTDRRGRDWDQVREKGYEVLTRPDGRLAFDLSREPEKLRDQYGRHPLGQNLLLARRLVEAGVGFVTVNGWTGKAPGEGNGPPSSSWDMHGGNMGMGDAFGNGSYGMGWCLPRLDEALSALLTDLKDRGMLESTLVVVLGEFGRTPKVLDQFPPGRQHWPACFSAIMAGCGVRGGAVYGESDKHAAYVKTNPVHPETFFATILHALDVPLNPAVTNSGISRPITNGKPILDLFS